MVTAIQFGVEFLICLLRDTENKWKKDIGGTGLH